MLRNESVYFLFIDVFQVLALVPGSRRSWEWLHFDPSIGTGRPSTATRDIYLYNQVRSLSHNQSILGI